MEGMIVFSSCSILWFRSLRRDIWRLLELVAAIQPRFGCSRPASG